MSELPDSRAASRGSGARIGPLLFLLWLFVVNLLYYFQFRGLFLSRFGSWIHRWR